MPLWIWGCLTSFSVMLFHISRRVGTSAGRLHYCFRSIPSLDQLWASPISPSISWWWRASVKQALSITDQASSISHAGSILCTIIKVCKLWSQDRKCFWYAFDCYTILPSLEVWHLQCCGKENTILLIIMVRRLVSLVAASTTLRICKLHESLLPGYFLYVESTNLLCICSLPQVCMRST